MALSRTKEGQAYVDGNSSLREPKTFPIEPRDPRIVTDDVFTGSTVNEDVDFEGLTKRVAQRKLAGYEMEGYDFLFSSRNNLHGALALFAKGVSNFNFRSRMDYYQKYCAASALAFVCSLFRNRDWYFPYRDEAPKPFPSSPLQPSREAHKSSGDRQSTRNFVAIGRNEDRKAVIKKLESFGTLLLCGAPGIGKSALAEDVQTYWKNEGWDVPEAVDMRLQSDEWAVHFLQHLVKTTAKDEDEARRHLMSHMAKKQTPILLTVENAEAVGEDMSKNFFTLLDDIVKSGNRDGVKCLIIARRRFVQRERLHYYELDVLSREASVDLFMRLANEDDKDVCTAEDAQSVVSSCGGIPLIITALAGRLRNKRSPAAKMIKRLHKNQGRLLQELQPGKRVRETNLYFSALDASFSELTEEDKITFISISAFPGIFEASEVGEVMSIAELEAEDRVRELTFWRELHTDSKDRDNKGRYEMHGIFKEFARYQVDANPSSFKKTYENSNAKVIVLIASKLIELSKAYAEDAEKAQKIYLKGSANFSYLFNTEILDNQSITKKLCEVALQCPYVFDAFVLTKTCMSFYQKCSRAAARYDYDLERCQLECWLSQDFGTEGNVKEAQECLRTAEACFKQLTDDKQNNLQGLLSYSKGYCTMRCNEGSENEEILSEALSCLEEAEKCLMKDADLGIIRKNDLIPGFVLISLAVRVYEELVNVTVHLGRPAGVVAVYAKKAQKIRPEEQRHPDTLTCLCSTAVALYVDKEYEKAHSLFARALEIQRIVFGTHKSTAINILNISQCYQKLKQFEEARAYAEESYIMLLEIYGEAHKETMRSLYEYAFAVQRLKRHDEAEKLFTRLLRLVKELSEEDRKALYFDETEIEKHMQMKGEVTQIAGDD